MANQLTLMIQCNMYTNWFSNHITKLYWDNVNYIKIRDLFLTVVCMQKLNGATAMTHNDFDLFLYTFLEYCQLLIHNIMHLPKSVACYLRLHNFIGIYFKHFQKHCFWAIKGFFFFWKRRWRNHISRRNTGVIDS